MKIMKSIEFVVRSFGGIVWANTHLTAEDYIKVYNPETDAKLLEGTFSYMYQDSDDVITIKTHRVQEEELPDWMTPEEFMEHHENIKILIDMGFEERFGENIRKLYDLHPDEWSLMMKLSLVKKFRSEFRKSLWEQFLSWMAGNGYKRPWTLKQVEAATRFR